ncbi:GNAT family N-acetyltransferase [Chitinophagaceae bacterium LB-8]|uniref:GNAT family N-acetyltransferase n=1 Tax=Paraflavisolibacter caeni TaxID=2982496 RepID=A0A9X2XTU5_9BACT|nr:GNAT family N-acetyltransferase [Paraflavisolibacter caeni]MCU7548337.1 GNAT family N-acetyltransferase [Paraflavisolibacter caeni]
MIELREAQFSDYAAIAKLHAESWKQNYRGIYSDHFLDNEVEQDRSDVWHQRLQFPSKNQRVTIATQDGSIVGFSCLYYNDDPNFGSLLDNLHISTSVQGSGIGTLLIRSCATQIFDNCTSDKMYLWVYESNIKARKFYERLGGVKLETVEKQNPDQTLSRVCRYIWNDVSALL